MVACGLYDLKHVLQSVFVSEQIGSQRFDQSGDICFIRRRRSSVDVNIAVGRHDSDVRKQMYPIGPVK